tara:strand:+ start:291 stop:515 length:225 start_codon:yes stop_codon:yes gene_type:complete
MNYRNEWLHRDCRGFYSGRIGDTHIAIRKLENGRWAYEIDYERGSVDYLTKRAAVAVAERIYYRAEMVRLGITS